MPGLTGIIYRHSPEDNAHDLQRMMTAMVHESTYNTGTYINEHIGVYLGWVCHKDSFVDCMPIWNEKKDKCLFFYGENFPNRETIDLLKTNGHEFTFNNASYLIHLFEDKGDSFFVDLNGFFIGVLIDISRNEVILFNDRYGMQRLYYYESKSAFFFSSEAKALLKVCPELREIVPASLGQLLSMGCVLDNDTLFKNIYLLPGASLWRFGNRNIVKKTRYFKQAYWENQAKLEIELFYDEVKETFIKILPKYLNDSRSVAVSLTGGLDTRMIMAHAQRRPDSLPCYTFGSMYRDSFDVRVARKVANVCKQKHYTVRVDKEFISSFPYLAEMAVYIADGYLDASDATELYVNRLAREIAPIRVTGNYGSEVLRSIRAFRPKPPNMNMFNGDLTKQIDQASEIFQNSTKGHKLTFTVFKQAPWFNYNRLSLEQSQLTMRTPFMDNELIAVVYRAPYEAITSDDISLRLVKDGNIELSKIITNRGVGGNSFHLLSKSIQLYYEILRLAEFSYDYGMPQWVSQIDRYLACFHLERLFLGRHKFYHFRIWFRNELATYVKEMLLDKVTLNRPYLNKKFVEKMVMDHIEGRMNYTTEVNKLITLELIQRLFMQ